MTLCSACKVLAKELFKKSTYEKLTHYDNRHRYYSRETRHLSSILDTLASAENCTFCALIRIGLEKYKSDRTDTDQDTFATSLESHFNEPLVISALGNSITHQNPDSLNLRHLVVKLPTNRINKWLLRLNVWATKGTCFRYLSDLSFCLTLSR
jgi:hypothetical protein